MSFGEVLDQAGWSLTEVRDSDNNALHRGVHADLSTGKADYLTPEEFDSFGTTELSAGPEGNIAVFHDIEALEGSAYNDVLVGNDAANGLWGAQGDDIIAGGGGNDTLSGGRRQRPLLVRRKLRRGCDHGLR